MPPAPARRASEAYALDGDTLDLGSTRHRLFGIDAPEREQRCSTASTGSWDCGEAARDRLAALLAMGEVTCTPVPGESDPYGRSISRCSAAGSDVAATLVGEGLARVWLRYSRDYEQLERTARRAGAGLWQGAHVAPWEWRRGGQSGRR